MPSRLAELHFRKYSRRGPLSSVMMDDGVGDVDVLTVFWTEFGFDPENEIESGQLLSQHREMIIAKAQDPVDMGVEKGVRRDPTSRSDWQRSVVDRLKSKVGW